MHRLFFISLDTPDREYMNCIPKLRRSGACGTARPECACSVQTRQSAARQNHMNPQVLHTEKLFVKKPFRDAVNPAWDGQAMLSALIRPLARSDRKTS